ncbi:MAG: hypothetical protein QOG33_2406 [Gaiellales bacterium]|nr:hypothetical protein [Gaiellales bacterium]
MIQTPTAKPMDLGAILDGSFSLYRRHFAVLVGAVGILTVPLALLAIPFGPYALFLTGLAGLVTPAIAAIVVGDVATGREPTIGGVWSRLGPLIVPLILTGILTWIVVILGTILLIIPGVLFYVWFALSAQAIAIEDRRYTGAMGRSRELVSGSWWRVFGILLLVAILGAIASQVVESALAAVLGALGVGNGFHGLRTGASGNVDLFPFVLSSTIASLLVGPITALAAALLYFDLRLRKEGTDIAAAVESLG